MAIISNLEYIILVLIMMAGIIKLRVKNGILLWSVSIGFWIIITTILERISNINARMLLSMLTIMVILFVLFDETVKHILIYTALSIASLGLLRGLADSIIQMIEIMMHISVKGIAEDICEQFFLILLLLLASYILSKQRRGLRDISLKYNLLILAMILVDCVSALFLGDYVITELNADRKWIIEVAYIVTILGIFVQLSLLISTILSRDEHKEKEALAAKYLEEQMAHYEYLEDREQETRKFRHDLKSHMNILRDLYDEGRMEEFEGYFATIGEKIAGLGNRINVGNKIADAIINRYAQEAGQQDICLRVSGHFPVCCHIAAYDLCTILSNLLSNAIRAEREAGKKEITLEIRNTEEELYMEVQNDYVNELKRSGQRFLSTKAGRGNHGIGLQNVRECVDKYHGILSITTDHQIFHVLLSLKNMEI